MIKIRKATIRDAETINDITHRAFMLYANELDSKTPVKALEEKSDAVIYDINNNHVFVAEDDSGFILGSIRYLKLTDELSYIYRFGVDPDINNIGIGSDLIKQVIDDCTAAGFKAIALHTNSKYYKLARYYYGKQFFVHSTTTDRGYIRALFVKELTNAKYDLTPAFNK